MLSSSLILTLASDKPETQLSAWYAFKFFFHLVHVCVKLRICFIILSRNIYDQFWGKNTIFWEWRVSVKIYVLCSSCVTHLHFRIIFTKMKIKSFLSVLTDIILLVHGCYMIDLYELTDLGNFKLLYLGV